MKRPGEEGVQLTCPSKVPHSSPTNMELSVNAPGPQPTIGTGLYPTVGSGPLAWRAGEEEKLHASAPGSSAGNMEPGLSELLDEMRFIANHFRRQSVDVAVCSEWKFAALVIDRLCLVAFSIVTIICTIVILMSAPNFAETISKDFI